ncbi:MAG TPA: choline dehydrogenase [Stellaceae bacterium]|nr:choline dehydrogenase [Stellaceae bacterium]
MARKAGPEEIEADYVIIGAGSAGCVLANRLSEDPTCRVVVIEAGGKDRSIWIHIPIGYGKTITDRRVNWCYETEPDEGVAGRRIFWPRGKVLGGSSSINGLVYIRGQAEDYDHWRQLGNPGWSFADVLPYFKKSEHQMRGADALHGVGGPLCVSNLGERHPLCEAFIEEAVALGIPRNEDFNGPSQEGVGYYQLTTRNGRRCSTAIAFLRPAMRRGNLRVLTHALAERILFEGRRAVGVSVRRGGETLRLRARREVILAAGAINSPQTLLLSGIGPAEELARHGILVIHELPGVGRNLQDHFQTRISHKCRLPITVNDIMANPLKKLGVGLQYVCFRKGPLTISAGQVGLFTRTRKELASPDIQYHFIVFSADRPTEGLHKFSGFTTNVCQLRPESRGTITLKSADPATPPAIRANYLAAELDRQTLVAGLKLGRRICSGPKMQHFILSEYLPGEGVQTDDEWLDYARRYGGSIFHPAGTCKMGNDAMAVVDPQLRVRGVEGLRVADASIMPTVVSGNTNAACIMIGEKAADLIREGAQARAA